MTSSILPVSAIILTHNEEANIKACMDSIAEWMGEIYVVDSGSTDQTLDIIRQFTDNIFHHPFVNYSRQRNWAQENLPIRHDWVFHIDADERVSPELASKIIKCFGDEVKIREISGILVRRRIEFLGKHIRYGGIYPTYHCRFFRKAAGRCEEREYDQHFMVEGSTIRIEGDLIEATAVSLQAWTVRHLRWAAMETQQLAKGRLETEKNALEPNIFGSPIQRKKWLRMYYERSPLFFRAFFYFLVRYLIRGGFLDGSPGLIYHVLHGFWFRFYIDACLFENDQNRKLKSVNPNKF
jgi:glycosyltransferase involved in cell wall biosynthesis